MIDFILLLKNSLVLIGAIFLLAAIIPIKNLIAQLPQGKLRIKWRALSYLIAFFIVGYLIYVILHWKIYTGAIDIVVPAIFFFGSIFVVLVGTLALQTANDINKISNLYKENITDPLIGIYNRRYFDQSLAGEIERAHKYGMDLCVLMLDVDHFKNINDSYGHFAGDIVLKKLGKIVKKLLHKTHILARYGGEEFAIITPDTDLDKANRLAEEVRHNVEKAVIILKNDEDYEETVAVTVSLGVADLCKTDKGNKCLIERADEALYKAKEKGRNRVICTRSKDISD